MTLKYAALVNCVDGNLRPGLSPPGPPQLALLTSVLVQRVSSGVVAGFLDRANVVHSRRRQLRVGASEIATLRGGDGGTVDIDLDRVGLRLGSLEEYCVIASIFLGAMIDIYGSKPEESPEKIVEQIAYGIHGICVAVGFLAAVYTTVVFSLFGLYAKTALGTGDDSGYLELLSKTGTIRFRGFESFLLCLFSFNTAFLMNLFLNHTGYTRVVVLFIAVAGTVFSMSQFRFIIDTASEVVFK